MDIPNLPTDNLYKFMALTGLLLMIGSFLIVFFQAEKSRELSREFDQSVAIAKAHLETAKAAPTKMGESPEVAAETLEKAKIQMAKSEAIQNELKLILDDKPTFLGFYLVGEVIGLILSISGFGLWYTRVQKYQDMLLKRQAMEEQQGGHSG